MRRGSEADAFGPLPLICVHPRHPRLRSSMRRRTDAIADAPPEDPRLASQPRTPRQWDELFEVLRTTVKTLPQQKAAMFMMADEGFGSVFEQVVAAIISVRTIEQVTLPASR